MAQVIAFDFGLSRIGVALGNTILKIPHPLTTVTGLNNYAKLDQIDELISKWQPEYFIVGMPEPRNDNALLIKSIQRFARRVAHRNRLTYHFIDEGFSSCEAAGKLLDLEIYGLKQKPYLDAQAACVILQRYFEIGLR